jgi:antitoxin ParD1/3/4
MDWNVDLGSKLEQVVTDLVDGGRYSSRDELLRVGVKLVQERERKLEEVNAGIERGLADVAAGRVHTVEEVRARLLERYRDWPQQNA